MTTRIVPNYTKDAESDRSAAPDAYGRSVDRTRDCSAIPTAETVKS